MTPPEKAELVAVDDGTRRAPQESASTVDEAALEVIDHLLWHKALEPDEKKDLRISEYIRMLEGSEEGEHVSIRDPFHRSIAIAFELVTQEHMNPWRIDLVRFSQLYLERARTDEDLELTLAGRIILMAWTVLKLQSDRLVEHAESFQQAQVTAEEFDWDSLPDWTMGDEEWDYTRRVTDPRTPPPIDEKVRHKSDRKVTLMELVTALEEAALEAEEHRRLMEERKKTRARMAAQGRRSVDEMMHKDDPERDREVVWQRILSFNGSEIPLTDLYADGDLDDFVMAFNSVLFLASAQKVWLRQDDFPWGPIYVTNLDRAPPPRPVKATRGAKAGSEEE